jgi:hypothetical protein
MSFVRFEVFTEVTMKNAVFWDVASCRSCVNRRSSETSVRTRSTRLHIPEDGILESPLFFLVVLKHVANNPFHSRVSYCSQWLSFPWGFHHSDLTPRYFFSYSMKRFDNFCIRNTTYTANPRFVQECMVLDRVCEHIINFC